MSWSDVGASLDSAIDAAESWIAGQSFWVQVPLLLAVLIPLTWLLAGWIDRLVDRILWPYHRKQAMSFSAHPAGTGRVRDTAESEPAASDGGAA